MSSTNAVLTYQSNFRETLLSFLMTFTICFNVIASDLLFFLLPEFLKWINSGSFLTCRSHSSLVSLEGMEVKNSWNLSSAHSLLRTVHLVDAKCFPPIWLHIKYVFAHLYSIESLKRSLHILQAILSSPLLPLLLTRSCGGC